MKIVDTTGIVYMLNQGRSASEPLYITPDIQEEFEAGYDRRRPTNIENLFDESWFDKGHYLDSYRKMLNAYAGRSFYNMTGFGDISILAALDVQRSAARQILPGLSDPVDIITSDKGLTKRIRTEFVSEGDAFSKALKIIKVEDYFV